jgi:hypothetical protein
MLPLPARLRRIDTRPFSSTRRNATLQVALRFSAYSKGLS